MFPPTLVSSPTTFATAVDDPSVGADIVIVGVVKYPDPAVDINPFAKEGNRANSK